MISVKLIINGKEDLLEGRTATVKFLDGTCQVFSSGGLCLNMDNVQYLSIDSSANIYDGKMEKLEGEVHELKDLVEWLEHREMELMQELGDCENALMDIKSGKGIKPLGSNTNGFITENRG